MAVEDQVSKSTTTHTPSRTGTHNGGTETTTNYGTGVETYDDDGATYYGQKEENAWDGWAQTVVVDQHTWTNAVDLAEVRFVAYANGYPYGNYEESTITFTAEVLQGSTWTSIYSYTSHKDYSTGGSKTNYLTNSQTLSTGWEDCLGVRITVTAYAYSYEGTRQQASTAYVYETSASYTVKKSFASII